MHLGESPDEVELLTRRFDDFKKDLKVNEARIVELNKIAHKLREMNQPESAKKIQDEIEILNIKWTELQKVSDSKIINYEIINNELQCRIKNYFWRELTKNKVN